MQPSSCGGAKIQSKMRWDARKGRTRAHLPGHCTELSPLWPPWHTPPTLPSERGDSRPSCHRLGESPPSPGHSRGVPAPRIVRRLAGRESPPTPTGSERRQLSGWGSFALIPVLLSAVRAPSRSLGLPELKAARRGGGRGCAGRPAVVAAHLAAAPQGRWRRRQHPLGEPWSRGAGSPRLGGPCGAGGAGAGAGAGACRGQCHSIPFICHEPVTNCRVPLSAAVSVGQW
ncbi:uncharacterized protein [Notamacropus eugenii]|uniref:uncharacterized protein n=1 Tax=Notamacropus eugenii TaxID=9315 RepID=UPI003B67B549